MEMTSSCMLQIISLNLQIPTKPPPSLVYKMFLVITRSRLKHVFQVISFFWLDMKHVFQVISFFWLDMKHVFQVISFFWLDMKHAFQVIISPFWLHLFYFISVSLLGLLLLNALPMKDPAIPKPSHLDLFFMSVSATTVSSMSTVEIESFSNSQLIVFTLLMLLGGEVFTSMLGLLIRNLSGYSTINNNQVVASISLEQEVERGSIMPVTIVPSQLASLKKRSLRCLLSVVLGYLILVHASGSLVIFLYLTLFPDTKAVLKRKGIRVGTFSVLLAVSSFANCGFVPTNENMEVFKTCSGILLTVRCLVLLGNTMYPIGLRVLVWVLKRFTKRKEFEFILSNDQRSGLGYDYHLMSGWLESGMLGATGCAFVLAQALLFCCLEWRSEGLNGMNTYQKVVGSWFLSVNSRHAGESIMDLSALSPAIWVLVVVMMYLPPYATYLPVAWRGEDRKKKTSFVENFIFSQLSYLAIFIIVVCITERRKLSEDPLNFNVLNIVIEVISAYGNVGFSTGYSCKRQLKVDGSGCTDSSVGFTGRWSGMGKITVIVVMIFGRMKKFNMRGGQAWMIR